jgi:hypothetical protein
MLIQLIYASRAVGPQTTAMTSSILATAQAHNKSHGITGVLCQGQGCFLQLLEGEEGAVNQLYSRILNDKRHQEIAVLDKAEITQRRFPNWSMAHVNLEEADPLVQAKEIALDTEATTGPEAIKLIEALIASGRLISAPVV